MPPKTIDIYEYGFNKSLNRTVLTISSPLMYEEIRGQQQSQNVNFGSQIIGSANTNISIDPKSGFWIGNEQFANAPFSVDMAGNIVATNLIKFGGTGADGALSITSGTTTLSLASATSFVRNYSSISITGTGVLAFSTSSANGTIIFLKSQGAVTLTSSATPMIDCSGLGGNGGAASALNGDGSNGSLGNSAVVQSNFGPLGKSAGNGSAGGAASASIVYILSPVGKIERVSCGAGGGSGGGGVGTSSGAGGKGGGALVIECNGAFNFTTASGISVAANNGGLGGGASAGDTGGAGGGGGGAGGVAALLYRTLTANTGTITVTGGNGGNGGPGGDTNVPRGSGGGGSGGANRYAGGSGGAGAASGTGTGGGAGSGTGGGSAGSGGAGGSGVPGNAGGGGGGGGSAGDSWSSSNTEFV